MIDDMAPVDTKYLPTTCLTSPVSKSNRPINLAELWYFTLSTSFLQSHKGDMKHLEMFLYFTKLAFPSKSGFRLRCTNRSEVWLVGRLLFRVLPENKAALSVGTISTYCFFQFSNHCYKSIRKAATLYYLLLYKYNAPRERILGRTLLFFSYAAFCLSPTDLK